MNVMVTPAVEIALRTLGNDDRRKVAAWLDTLKNWEDDSFVRQHSEKLPSPPDVYVLKTSGDIRIFFRLEEQSITILDIATRMTILTSGQATGAGK